MMMPWPIALCWDGQKGYANCDGVHVSLRCAPCPDWYGVEFVPGLHVEIVRDRAVDSLRDMTEAERERATLIAAQLVRETPCD